MKAIIILSLSTIAHAAFSQQQQQQQQQQQRNVIPINNVGNVNFIKNAVLNNVQQTGFNNEQKQQVKINIARVSPVRKYTQVKVASNTVKNPTQQVRRRTRPRPVNTKPQVLSQPQVINVPETNEMLSANNINVPAQNISLGNNFDIQSQDISNIINEDANPFVQKENNGNKEILQINTDLDLSLNLKGASTGRSRSSSSSFSSSSHSKAHVFSKKMAKLKRNFFGKLSSHKKGNHRIDLCFNWK